MKVLQICHKIPFPPNDGGTLAMYQLSKAMLDMGWSVKLLGIGTKKHPIVEMPLDDVYKQTHPKGVFIDTHPTLTSLIFGIFTQHNFIATRFNTPEMRGLISKTLSKHTFDMVILEGSFMAVFIDLIKKKFNGTIVLRAHNVEFQLWEDRLTNEKSLIKRWLLKKPVNHLRTFELSELKKADVVATISMGDKAFFNSYIGLNKTMYLPFGFALPETETAIDAAEENKIVYLGALDWEPNLQGLQWFLEEVWPIIQKKNPVIEFHIAGRNASSNFAKKLPQRVTFIGEVDDAQSCIAGGAIFVVPLLAGSGVRIKIIEAMALGQVVATTTKGAAGIPVQHERNILIGDSPKALAHHILNAIKNPKLRKSISTQAKILAKKEFDITNTQKALLQLVKSYIR